jgi:glycosyltransferase involved in cell wall biosynthesis
MEQRDALDAILSTYPKFKLDTSGIPNRKVKSIRHPEVVLQLGHRLDIIDRWLSKFTQWNRPTARMRGKLFDNYVSKYLENSHSDIYVGFAGTTHQSLITANDQGMTTIVERCSTHIRSQAKLLRKEYERQGNQRPPISDAHIRREEKEYELADRVIVPSEFVYDSFLEQDFPEKKLIMEPFAVDVEAYRPNYDSDGKTQFLFAGIVGLRKGIPDLLNAWQQLDLDGAELLIAGSIESEVEDLVSQYQSHNTVQFLGWCDNLGELYRESDVFVFPSIEEGSANVTYEAMASGLPLVTTPNSGWVGEGGKHGVEVRARDPPALASGIKELHQNPEQRKQMGRNARELMETDYTWDRYGDRIYKQYKLL